MGWGRPEPRSPDSQSSALCFQQGYWRALGEQQQCCGWALVTQAGPTLLAALDPLTSLSSPGSHPLSPSPRPSLCLLSPLSPPWWNPPPAPQEEMTSALATMRVDYEQIKIKKIEDASNPLLLKRRKKARALEAAALAH